jgi:hypothetical protein
VATPVFQQLAVYALKFGGVYVPWNGSVTSAQIVSAAGIRFQPRVNDVGSFSFEAATAPNPTVAPLGGVLAATGTPDPLLPKGTIVVFDLVESAADQSTAGDAALAYYVCAGVIEGRAVNWTDNELPIVTYTGRTWAGLLEDVMVYPYGGLTTRPYTDARIFSWASPGFDDSGWGAAKQLTTQGTGSTPWTLDSGQVAPAGWPFEPNAYWIWADNPGGAGHTPATGSTSTTANADIGTCLFRKAWTPSAATTYAIFVTADNYYTAYLNGVEIMSNRDNIYGWQTCTRFDVTVDTTAKVLAVRGENVGGLGSNPGGVLVSVRKVNADGTLSAEIVSDSSWKAYAYPSDAAYPGWTAGGIVTTLITEALARDTSNRSPLRAHTTSYSFTASTDSGAVAFATLPEISLPVGSSLLDTLRTLKAQGGAVWIDTPRPALAHATGIASTVKLNLYTGYPAEVDKGAFTLGANLLALSYNTGDGA